MTLPTYERLAAALDRSRAAHPRSRSAPILRVEHLSMRFGGLVAVNDLSFTASASRHHRPDRPNGAGKTTVFNCITGFYKPTEGRIALQFGDARRVERNRFADRARHAQHRARQRLAVSA